MVCKLKPAPRKKTSAVARAAQDRAERLAQVENEYLFNDAFRRPKAEAEILSDAALETQPGPSTWKPGREMPAHLARMCERKLLTQAEETGYFRRMNFAKYKADVLRRKLRVDAPDQRLMTQIEDLLALALRDRNEIVRANLRLVVSIAKKFGDPRLPFDELLSEGIETLVRAVEKFDYSRGFRFSTYATMAVRRTICRLMQTAHRDRQRLVVGDPTLFEDRAEEPSEPILSERRFHELRSTLGKLLGKLDPREQSIIRRRFGLDHDENIQTLQSLAADMGVCKERVRQLEMRAIAKLRKLADEVQLRLPADD